MTRSALCDLQLWFAQRPWRQDLRSLGSRLTALNGCSPDEDRGDEKKNATPEEHHSKRDEGHLVPGSGGSHPDGQFPSSAVSRSGKTNGCEDCAHCDKQRGENHATESQRPQKR